MQPLTLALFALAVVLGATTPFQAGSNAVLARFYGHALYAALTNTVVASLVLAASVILLRAPAPALGGIGNAPWWTWLGGVYGACLVLGGVTLAPRLGAAGYLSAIIAGTVIASVLVDHFGLVGFPEHRLDPLRALGALMVVAGMLIVQLR